MENWTAAPARRIARSVSPGTVRISLRSPGVTPSRTAHSASTHVAIGVDAAVFEVTDLVTDGETIVAGETVTATATVENVGLRNGSYAGEVVVDGSVVDSVTAYLASNGTAAVNATHSFETAGTYELCLDGQRLDYRRGRSERDGRGRRKRNQRR